MKILYVFAALVLVALPAAHADEIPDWIRDIALFWSQGQISDEEFTGAMRYLSENDIIAMPDVKPETAELPFRITAQHTTSESGTCEIVIEKTGRIITAVTEPPRVMCDIRVYEEAEESMLGGIKAMHADGTYSIIYSPWNPFEGDVTTWDFAGSIGIELVYHDITGSYADDYGTIFFNEEGRRTIHIKD
ncbi:MAG: hypothetical protein D9C04_07095 [Nitrosopumilus sp. B06]|nr:MAG: hypothetical protein D9C04_07095 [Nitrosopumilus sp. B06]